MKKHFVLMMIVAVVFFLIIMFMMSRVYLLSTSPYEVGIDEYVSDYREDESEASDKYAPNKGKEELKMEGYFTGVYEVEEYADGAENIISTDSNIYYACIKGEDDSAQVCIQVVKGTESYEKSMKFEEGEKIFIQGENMDGRYLHLKDNDTEWLYFLYEGEVGEV